MRLLVSLTLLIMLIGASVSRAEEPIKAAAPDECQAESISTPQARPHFQFWWKHRTGGASVQFQLHIASDGTVSDVRILPGDYHRDFAIETLKTVRTWSFKPLNCGPPDGIWIKSIMTFQAPEETSNNSFQPKPVGWVGFINPASQSNKAKRWVDETNPALRARYRSRIAQQAG